MKTYLIPIFLISLVSCKNERKLEIIKQWHLASHEQTLNIEESKKLPQYKNQKEIYKYLEKRYLENRNLVVLAEGCEGSIKEKFQIKYNGWNLESLKAYTESKQFKNIMAPVPMKLLAKYPNANIICGDSESLIKENLKALSDLRGFTGFYQKLKLFKKTDPEKFLKYKNQLLEIYPEAIEKNILRFSLNKAKDALNRFELFLKKRNSIFIKRLAKSKGSDFVVVIGGLHSLDLETRAKEKGFITKTTTLKNYSKDESLLILGLKEILENEVVNDLSYFQVPNGFQHKTFPVSNKISDSSLLFSDDELDQMNLIIKGKLDFDLLLSDFDQDGIRDFTLSTTGTDLILSAEDSDWDNDGIGNLEDPSVGEYIVGKEVNEIRINNNYFSQKEKNRVLNRTKKYVKVLSSKEVSHEQIVLEVFNQLAPKFKERIKKLKYIKATDPVFNYGKRVFFSYIPQSQTIEYYPAKLSLFLNQEYQLKFKGTDFKLFVQSFVIPIIVHSLAHEVGHIIENREIPKRWKIKKEPYLGKYLNSYRLKEKVIDQITISQVFLNKGFDKWLDDYKEYVKEVNLILRSPNRQRQLELIRKTKYKTKIKSSLLEHQLSFLSLFKIPSIYSLKKISEWHAEMFAACVFQEVFPNSKTVKRAVELEHLMGFNPLAVSASYCNKAKKTY